MEEVAIVIPSVGRAAELARCVASVAASARASETRARIVVVAGGYAADELTAVRDAGAEIVEVSPMPRVSAARNLGARRARGPFVIFLDDDNSVAPSFLREMLAQARRGGATMLAPAMYYGDAPDRAWCLAVRRTPLLLRTQFATREPEPRRDRLPSEGFPNCFLVLREQFEAVGGFDETRFPQHFEESDLAQRLLAAYGAPAFGIPRAKIWHHLPRGLTRRYHLKNAFMAYQCARARAVYTALYGTSLQRAIFTAFGQFFFAGVYLTMIASGRRDVATLAGAYVRGAWDGWREGAASRRAAGPPRRAALQAARERVARDVDAGG